MHDRPCRTETITPPAAHAGIIRALDACYAAPPSLPAEWTRLLDRLR